MVETLASWLTQKIGACSYTWNLVQERMMDAEGDELPLGANHAGWTLVHRLLQVRMWHALSVFPPPPILLLQAHVIWRMLQRDPALRPTVQEALCNPYLAGESAPPPPGPLAEVFSSVQLALAGMRRDDVESVVLEMTDESDWPGFLHALCKPELDLCRNLRVRVGEFEYRPFSQIAQAALEWACDPAQGLVVEAGSGILPAVGAAHVDAWRGLGRMLAKCAMDGVEVRSPLGSLFFRYLGTGQACMRLDATMALLTEHFPDKAMEWQTLLTQRLCQGSPKLTLHSHSGHEEAEDAPVSDANKRNVVRRWARHMLIVDRQRHLDAAHHGFLEALDWADLLYLLCAHADDVRVLLAGGPDLDVEAVVSRLKFTDADDANGLCDDVRNNRRFLHNFLRECPQMQLRQFVARVTTSADEPIAVALSQTARRISFIRAKRLVGYYWTSCLLLATERGSPCPHFAGLMRHPVDAGGLPRVRQRR